MKYVFLVYEDARQPGATSASERAAYEEACRIHEQDLKRGGYLYAVEDSQDSNIIVQLMDGRLTLTDGPLISTTGLSVQLFFIHARDLNAAIQIASQMPQARVGLVEVRAILDIEPGNGL